MRMNKLKIIISLLCILSIFFCSCKDNKPLNNTDFFAVIPVEKANPLPEDALPDFNDYFVPEGVKTEIEVSGGDKLPVIGSTSVDNAPSISEFSNLTFEDETLAITGEGLTNSSILLWVEGMFTEVNPLRADNSKMQVIVPEGAGESMMIIWPKNENGVGSPVRVNAPEIWWIDKDSLYTDSIDSDICIYGSGLALDGKTPTVLALHSDGTEETLNIIDANPYQLKVSYPKKMTAIVKYMCITAQAVNTVGVMHGFLRLKVLRNL